VSVDGQVGRTKDVGWEIGVSRTVDHPVEQVWAFLTSPAGTAVWLGQGVEVLPDPGQPYETADGTTGQTRSFHHEDRIRLTWRPEDWDHESTVQIVVRPSGPGRTMLRFHQERLANAREREQQRAHWRAVMAAVVEALDAADEAR
jgi:uncharacterized protein YndB with AHSA1/START domain